MPDITMCKNASCSSKLQCYRFMVKPDEWQAFADYEVPEGMDKCDSFESIQDKSNVTNLSYWEALMLFSKQMEESRKEENK